jgi:hypothetical protein
VLLHRDLQAIVVLVRDDAEVVSWPLTRRRRTDLEVADELARLQLAARRMGCEIRLRQPRAELRELLELTGLRDVIVEAALRVEVVGEPEGGEQRRVDEVVVRDDPVA